MHTKDKPTYIHFGVGGAGNCMNAASHELRRPSWEGDSQSPTPVEAANTNTAGRRYSTGIGGTGNISFAKKVEARQGEGQDDDLARLLHDRSAHGIVLAEGGHHVGIGGFANRYHPTNEEDQEARHNNETMRRQSLAGVAARKASMANVVPSSKSGEAGRQGSIASMRDFVLGMGRRGSKP
ncbi:hypothetical protein H2200_009416 [Cladophialophora chaetospira]|uniref:Uncharacterized protein n=1 Tax=Cladophialophora chaetospira TaxID=386627 RepID=A0AA38X4F0_9EURO|nr:hypothetical protein H2200_009416 [Cladophialophora chaetospira]